MKAGCWLRCCYESKGRLMGRHCRSGSWDGEKESELRGISELEPSSFGDIGWMAEVSRRERWTLLLSPVPCLEDRKY